MAGAGTGGASFIDVAEVAGLRDRLVAAGRGIEGCAVSVHRSGVGEVMGVIDEVCATLAGARGALAGEVAVLAGGVAAACAQARVADRPTQTTVVM